MDNFKVYITKNGFGIDDVSGLFLDGKQKELYETYKQNPNLFFYNLAFLDDFKVSLSLEFLQYVSKKFLKRIVDSKELNFGIISDTQISDSEIKAIIANVPMIVGHEFVDESWIIQQQIKFDDLVKQEIEASKKNPINFLTSKKEDLVIPSRIYFHLVTNENNDDRRYPFAFLATYTVKNGNKISHVPLKNALLEFKNNKKELSLLISSIRKSETTSEFVSKYLHSGEIFLPMKISEKDAYVFLKEVHIFENCGIVCRIPKWYTESESKICIDFDEIQFWSLHFLSQAALNYFSPKLIYKGVDISVDEAKLLLEQKEGLEFIKGKWVENNHQELEALLNEYESYSRDGTTLLEILKSKAGLTKKINKSLIEIEFTRKDWLQQCIDKSLRTNCCEVPIKFETILRQYQKEAFFWLCGMYDLGFGVCLADDMGLGKTVEVISFLEKFRENNCGHVLIVVPATLVANWQSEMRKFAPEIEMFVLKGNNEPKEGTFKSFITITTYQTVLKSNYLNTVCWDVIILDEAQAIKNYYTSFAKKIKSLNSKMRIAMTGTPIENNVLELWSIFDFLNPGLLGARNQFKNLYTSGQDANIKIKELIQPFVLRRVKTDKKIISDLPEKNEIDVTINMTKEQIVLYNKVVENMNDEVMSAKDTMKVQVTKLSTVMKLKQVCNHPSQYYGLSNYDENKSGKFIELRNICETIYSKREKVLVFTQFKEIIPALNNILKSIFRCDGVTIDGDTSMSKRNKYVTDFQNGKYPYMVLSLKTAGVGLNLTEAQNVIHFDRWWNPAVENQATDRVYRIGQKNNVTIYKFVTSNTIEELINDMLKKKQDLADEYINDLNDNVLSKLSTKEILKTISYGGEEID